MRKTFGKRIAVGLQEKTYKRTILLKLTFSFLFVGSRLLFEDTRRVDIASKRFL